MEKGFVLGGGDFVRAKFCFHWVSRAYLFLSSPPPPPNPQAAKTQAEKLALQHRTEMGGEGKVDKGDDDAANANLKPVVTPKRKGTKGGELAPSLGLWDEDGELQNDDNDDNIDSIMKSPRARTPRGGVFATPQRSPSGRAAAGSPSDIFKIEGPCQVPGIPTLTTTTSSV